MLRARQARREDFVGTWLPEPIVRIEDSDDPEQQTLLADSVGLALLVRSPGAVVDRIFRSVLSTLTTVGADDAHAS
jgi:hypothetical protein